MNAMYRGSRLAASFLLFVTGLAALAAAFFVVPPVVPPVVPAGAGRILVPVALAFAIAHFVALAGVARGRDWGRNLAVFVAEMGGGLAILGAVTLLVGENPFGRESAAGPGLVAWAAAVYALLGIAAARVPVLAQLSTLERRRVVLGPSFHGVA
jgi:alpha-beta hydrolase superfamily lysophospholipase